MPSFQISDAPTQLQMQPAGADGVIPPAKVSFTLRNMGARAQTGRIRVEPQSGADAAWFAITGAPATSPAEIEKEFAFGGNEAIEVTVAPPKGAPAGKYGLRLKVAAEEDPDTDFAEGPTVGFDLAAPPVVVTPHKPFPWWIVAVAAVLVLVAAGVGGFFIWKGMGSDRPVMPEVAAMRAELAALEVALAGNGVTFQTTREGEGNPLEVVSSDPKAGKKLKEETVVDLTIKAPGGACNSLVCAFPGAIFPASVISTLVAEGFDMKYAPALSVENNIVTVDDALLNQIKNAAPPLPLVNLPPLHNIHVNQAQAILAELGLGVSLNYVSDGNPNGIVQRSEPGGPIRIEKGTTVALFYNPEPCRGFFCGQVWEFQSEPMILAPSVLRQMQLHVPSP